MSRGRLRGALATLAVLAGVMAVFAGPASAAGAPEIVGSYPAIKKLTSVERLWLVNPNGAASTAKFQYKLSSAEKWTEAGEISIGSSSTPIDVSKLFVGLKPGTNYSFNLVVTNKYGTAELGGVSKTFHWFGMEGQGVTLPSEFVSTGTFKVEIPNIGGTYFIDCTAKGLGTLGNAGGTGDKYNFALSKCLLTGPSKECTVTALGEIKLSGTLQGTESPYMVVFNAPASKCNFFTEEIGILVGAGFDTSVGEPGTSLSVTLTEPSKYLNMTANLTLSGTWQLIGANEGKGFGVGQFG
jgi:hypothetical protein